ncbi:MAG: hypothetical protein MSH49_10650 [[Eubacterium] saphenum]|nr:hypothetical protein [[Eubacterium] saphenum]
MDNKTEKQVFRQKSVERISSPEQLNDYVRVSNPSVWMILAAVVFILAGVCVWGIFGRLDTVIDTVGVCRDGKLTCYVADEDIKTVKMGMKISVNGGDYEISGIAKTPIEVDENFDSYAMYVGELKEGEWVYEVTAKAPIESGTYNAKIITNSVSPISFVMN